MGQIILAVFLAFVSVFLVPVSLSDRALAIEQASFEPPVIFGIVNNPNRNNVNCKIDFVNKTLSLLFDFKDRGSADIKGNIDSKGQYNLNVALRHFKLGRADILTDFQTTGFLAYSKDGKLNILKGKAYTQRTLLNLKPVQEFQIEYEFHKDRLKIDSFVWTDMKITGFIQLKPGYPVDLTLVINNTELSSLMELFGIDAKALGSEGNVSGNFRIKGPLAEASIKGRLTAAKGKVSRIEFTSARLNLEGNWPVLRFSDSYINDVAGIVYQLKGQFNLKEFADFGSPEHKVMVCCSNSAMRFQDWVIKRGPDENGKDMVEAEYPLKKNQALKMRIKNEEEIVAWEKKVKF